MPKQELWELDELVSAIEAMVSRKRRELSILLQSLQVIEEQRNRLQTKRKTGRGR